jgi:site-specific DNA-adenine methylase
VLNEPEAFIYLDPPYVLQAEKLYEQGTFDHARLAEYLSGLPKNIQFLLSYDDSAYTRNLYRSKDGIRIGQYKLPRGYCTGSSGKDTSLNGEELFISNYKL